MAYSDSDELLAAALAQLAREQGDPSLVAHSMVDPSGSHIPYTDTEEPHDFTPIGSGSLHDAYNPGLHDPEAVKKGERLDDSNMIRYSTEDAIQDEVSNALYDELFKMARANSANPHRTFIKDPTGSGKLLPFSLPIDLRTPDEKMGGHPVNQI